MAMTAAHKILVGTRIAKHRERLELTQPKMARKIGCHTSQLSLYENGHRAVPIPHLIRISRITGVSIDALVAPR